MVDTGYFEGFDFMYGFHFWATLPTGQINIKDGPASANSDLFEIAITGRGGHGGRRAGEPDPDHRGAPRGAPFAGSGVHHLSGGRQAGGAQRHPRHSRLGGSIRTTDDETRAVVRSSLENFVAGLEAANPGLTAELDYLVGYDAVLNDPACTAVVRELAAPIWGEDAIIEEPVVLGGEDFAAFSRVAPACYEFIGAGNEQFDSSHHSPTFGLDEASFGPALELAVAVVRNGPRFGP